MNDSRSLPPGPRATAAVQSVLFARDPVGALLRARGRYGPVFTLRFATVGPVVVIDDPDLAVRVIRADPAVTRAGAARRGVLPQASARSMFGADGPRHDAARGHGQAAFAADAVAAHREEIAALAERHVAGWPIGRPFRLLSLLRTLTEETFVRYVLGVRRDARARALVRAVGATLRTPGNPPLAAPDRDQLPPLGRLVDAAFQRRLRPVRALLRHEIAERRAGRDDGTGMLAALAATDLAPEAIVAELLAVLAAAQEPPSIGLTRVIDRLARSPELARELEAAGPDDPLFAAVVAETLRLHPPALAALRRLAAPVPAGAHTLPTGTDVMLALPLLHRNPAVFPDPLRFLPRRFLDAPAPASFLPFGDGRRRCPGEPLAGVEFRAIVPTVLRRLRLQPLSRRPERAVQRATVLVPQRSGLMIARRRG